MEQFDFYEFAGILCPGAIILFGLSQLFPNFGGALINDKMSVGDLGLFTILSYAVGHLLQLIGDIIEKLWWFFWGGMPTDWVHKNKTKCGRELLSNELRKLVLKKCKEKLWIPTNIEPLEAIEDELWRPLVRQIYADVAAKELSQRVDAFNRTYGMLRGLAAALLVIAVAFVCKNHTGTWITGTAVLLGLALCALVRMHSFGKLYARELFVQFVAEKPA